MRTLGVFLAVLILCVVGGAFAYAVLSPDVNPTAVINEAANSLAGLELPSQEEIDKANRLTQQAVEAAATAQAQAAQAQAIAEEAIAQRDEAIALAQAQPTAAPQQVVSDSSKSSSAQSGAVEVAVDWNTGAFGDSLFDENTNPTMVIEPGHGAIYTSDPADFYVNDTFVFGGQTSNQGLVVHIQNESDKPITVRVDIGYYNSTWKRPNGELGRWSVHTVEYSGTFAEVKAMADQLQFSENKPLYYTLAYPSTGTTTQPTPAPTAQPTPAPTAQPTVVPTTMPSACVDNAATGFGPAWISSDPGTLNGVAIPERFTAYIGSVPYALAGMGSNFNVYCGAPPEFEQNYDKAPLRATIHPDGSVTYVAVNP